MNTDLPCGGLHYLFSHRCQMNTDLEFLGGGITKTIKTPNCIFRKPLALHSLLYFSAREQALFHRLTAKNVAEHALLPENTVGR